MDAPSSYEMSSRKTLAVWVTVFLVLSFLVVWSYFIYKRYIAKHSTSRRDCPNTAGSNCNRNALESRENDVLQRRNQQQDIETSFLAANNPFIVNAHCSQILQPPSYDFATTQDLNELPPSYEEATKHMQGS